MPAFVEQEAAANPELYDDALRSLVEAGFAELPPGAQDELLRELEGGEFFETVRLHAIQALFSRPDGFAIVGWPGPKPVWSAEEQELR